MTFHTDEEYNELLKDFGDALDEVYNLRTQMAYEGMVVRAQVLSLKSFPKGRRKIMQERVNKMFEAARGRAALALAGTSYLSLDHARAEAGISKTLTRHEWKQARNA